MVRSGRATMLFSATARCKLYILHLDSRYDKIFAIDSRSTITLDLRTNSLAYQQSDKAYGINGDPRFFDTAEPPLPSLRRSDTCTRARGTLVSDASRKMLGS